MKNFKPQLCYNGSYMYYISSVTGLVVVSYIQNTTIENPYVNEDNNFHNYNCQNEKFSCSFFLDSDYMVFYGNYWKNLIVVYQGVQVKLILLALMLMIYFIGMGMGIGINMVMVMVMVIVFILIKRTLCQLHLINNKICLKSCIKSTTIIIQ